MAIDWSGRSGPDQRRFLWLAEAVDGELVRLENGRTRAELVELLIAEADRDPNLIVGVDFAFSLPAWYLQERQLTPRQVWALLADEALTPTMRQLGLTRWMNRPELPFWITGEAHAQLPPAQMLRRTEQEVRVPGVQPKSVFQLVGGGQVGRGSLYGMGALHRLADAGLRIWPFDPSGLPLVVEIFPRVLVGTPGCAGYHYVRRKLAEGKTTREAMRCLKRRIADHVWRVMLTDEQAYQQHKHQAA